MSTVTDVVVTCCLLDESTAERVLQFKQGKMVQVDQHAGGNKAMQMAVFLGAFNHFDDDDLVKVLRDTKWVSPESVIVLLQHEHEEWARVLSWWDVDVPGLHFVMKVRK